MDVYDVVIIGGGPGGYVAAIRARQLGLKAALVEKEHMGGVCLNWGCIPTKSLLRNAEVIRLLEEGKTFGFSIEGGVTVDYGAAHARSRKVSARLVKGIQGLMKKNGVEVFEGYGRLLSPGRVGVTPTEGEAVGGQRFEGVLEARNVVIATGAHPLGIPGVEIDGERVITSRHALDMRELPESVVVVGAGAIGVEFASLWRSYGVQVTLIEMLPSILPLEDADVGAELEKLLKRQKIKVMTGTRVEGVKAGKSGLTLSLSSEGGASELEAQKVLIAGGVRGNVEDLGLEDAGVGVERGFIPVDDRMQTNVPGVYAIGDVTGRMMLAHVASAQGFVAVEAIAGGSPQKLDYVNMPRCVYSHPEVASVGLTERQAVEQGYDVKTGSFPFRANGKALGLDDYEGFVKIVAEGRYDELLGVHMIGPHVTEMVAGPTGMIHLETTVEELARTVHPHPTLSEVIMEAAHALHGQAVHI